MPSRDYEKTRDASSSSEDLDVERRADGGQQPRRHRRILLIGAITAVLILAIIAIALGVTLTRDDGNNASAASQPQSSAATIASAPTPTASSNSSKTAGSYYKPSMHDTFLYDLETPAIDVPTIKSDTNVELDVSLYIVDLFDTSAQQIAAYKQTGKRVICYFSAGSYEGWRSDAAQFDPACYCGAGEKYDSSGKCASDVNKLDGWDEWWLDIHSAKCVQNVEAVISKRLALAASKGCDGVDPDNVDGFDNRQEHGITEDDAASYVNWLAQSGRSAGLAVGLKNAAALVPAVVANVDFSVTESCVQYDECDSYDAFAKAGKPQFDVEYGSSLKSCPAGNDAPHRMMQYSKDALNHKWITLTCQS